MKAMIVIPLPMKKILTVLIVLLIAAPFAPAENWPQWRGPRLDGVSSEKNLPWRWSKEDNVAWKVALTGPSAATPVIWGDRVFLNVTEGEQMQLWCIDRKQGDVLWKKPISGKNLKLNKHNISSPSPVTDGKNVYVINAYGRLYGFDFAGNELWQRDLWKDYGRFGLRFGHASSPLLFEDSLYFQILQVTEKNDPSYLLRIDKVSGNTVWKTDFPAMEKFKPAEGYSTPALLKRGNSVELIVNGSDQVTGHDLKTGRELWRVDGLSPDKEPSRIASSPVIVDGVIYAPASYRPLLALRSGGRGSLDESYRLWTSRNGPDIPSPVTDGKLFYMVNDKGIVRCLDAKTGKEIWGPERLKPGDYSSSPVLADGKLYIVSEEGATTVLRAGPKFEILAENILDDACLSSPAISDGQIFIRTAQFLYCIGKRGK